MRGISPAKLSSSRAQLSLWWLLVLLVLLVGGLWLKR